MGLLEEFRHTHRTVDYLDFATGTGRVISFLKDLVDTSLGIEISSVMAERAERWSGARILCRDITAPNVPCEGKYDFITAFRFFLNAEPALRTVALKVLASRLRDRGSCLVFNNHGYTWSYRLFGYPFYMIKSFRNFREKQNFMAHREVMRMADQAGLKICKVFGYGVFSGKVARLMSVDKAIRLERAACRNRVLSKFGAHQIYVAMLK